MENNIFEIIIDNVDQIGYFKSDMKVAAEEITAHIKEFIEWKDNQDTIKIYDDPDVYINLDDNKLMSLDEVFQYWCDKIKDK